MRILTTIHPSGYLNISINSFIKTALTAQNKGVSNVRGL